MSTLINPCIRAIDNNGDPIAGAKLLTFEAGTVTPLATFSDAALTVPHANPVLADANGYFPRVFGTTADYKLRLTDAADVQIWEKDDYNFVSLQNDDLVLRLAQVASNPIDHGAAGDGATNDSAAMQLAIDNATMVIDLLGLTYKCDDQITIPSNKRFINGTIDVTACTDDPCIDISGTFGPNLDVALNTVIGDITVQLVDASTVPENSYIHLSDDASLYTTETTGSIEHVDTKSGNVLTLSTETPFGYLTANDYNANILTMVQNVSFDNVTIIGSTDVTDPQTMNLFATENVTFRDCKFTQARNNATVLARFSVGTTFENCEFSDPVAGSSSLGVDAASSCRDVTFYDCRFIDMVTTGVRFGRVFSLDEPGASRGLSVRDCVFDVKGIGVDSDGFDASIVDCKFSGTTGMRGSANLTARGNRFYNCIPINYVNDVDVSASVSPFALSLHDNISYDCPSTSGAFRIDTTAFSSLLDNVDINGMQVLNCAGEGLVIGSGVFDTVSIRGLLVSNPVDSGFLMTATIATLLMSDFVITGLASGVGNNVLISGNGTRMVCSNMYLENTIVLRAAFRITGAWTTLVGSNLHGQVGAGANILDTSSIANQSWSHAVVVGSGTPFNTSGAFDLVVDAS